jgi:recombination protein RecT
MMACEMGLEPCGALGHGYLVPYENRKTGRFEAQFIPGYRGLIDLAIRSGGASRIESTIVRKGDLFKVIAGDSPSFTHEPNIESDGEMIAVYAIARLKSGEIVRDWMRKSDVDKVRQRSRSSNSGPWVTDYEEMARKTVVKRLMKYVPMSVEVANVLEHESVVDFVPDFSNALPQADESSPLALPHESASVPRIDSVFATPAPEKFDAVAEIKKAIGEEDPAGFLPMIGAAGFDVIATWTPERAAAAVASIRAKRFGSKRGGK